MISPKPPMLRIRYRSALGSGEEIKRKTYRYRWFEQQLGLGTLQVLSTEQRCYDWTATRLSFVVSAKDLLDFCRVKL